MDARRLIPLGLGVTALLVVAGIASHGRPLSGASRGTGPTAVFFDYIWTTVVLFVLAMAAVVVYALLSAHPSRPKPRVRGFYLISATLMMFAAAGVAVLLLRTGFIDRFKHAVDQEQAGQPAGSPRKARQPAGTNVRNPRVRWDETGVVLVLLAGVVVVLLGSRAARRAGRPLRRSAQQAVTLALDESLDDLRREPDLRRAIIAAYARMERALAAAGIPRDAADAPFEYLERALRSLDTSAASVRHLTDLFERAKFSQHEPEPAMRDEAIDALLAVRDELRRPAEAAVA